MRGAFLKKCDEGNHFHLEQEIACSDEGSLFEKVRWGEPFWKSAMRGAFLKNCDEGSLFDFTKQARIKIIDYSYHKSSKS